MIADLEHALSFNATGPFDFFISYRVRADSEFANSLFRILNGAPLLPTATSKPHNDKLIAYLDKVRLLDGERFDIGFMEGLASSAVFGPLLSTGCIAPLCDLAKEDRLDFVLCEWIMALELHKLGIIKYIFPIVIAVSYTHLTLPTKA